MSHLCWTSLEIGYRGRPLRSIDDCAVSAGELLLVTGANGSGKTTLLKTLAGLLDPVRGTIEPSPDHSRFTYVHSSPYLFRGTVERNLRMVTDEETAGEEARRLDLEPLMSRSVNELSAGQAQRLALARAMATRPSVLLLDEPEGSLDEASLARWSERIEECVRQRNLLIILASHRPDRWKLPRRVIEL